MLKKILIFIFCSAFIFGCEYRPVYQENVNNKINIDIISIEGDSSINPIIKSGLRRYSKNDSLKKYKISIISNYSKNELSRDITGKVTNYRGTIFVNFEVNINESQVKKNFKFQKNFNIKNTLNNFEQLNYENTLKKNLTSTILNEFLKELLLI